jgi:hypothetical protein
MDHRLAFATLVVLLIGAGTPLAFAWARLLPEDAPPFPIEPGSFPSVDHEAPPEEAPSQKKDYLIAAPLLFLLTIAFVFRVPGFPTSTVLAWIGKAIPGLGPHWSDLQVHSAVQWSALALHAFVVLVTIGVGVFGARRPGPLRSPLIAASALILLLWFVGPLLQTAVAVGK